MSKTPVRASMAIWEAMDEIPLRMRLMGWKGVRSDGTEWKVIIPERYRSEFKLFYEEI